MEHGSDPVEQLLASIDFVLVDIAPGDGDPKGGPCLGVGSRRRGEASHAVPTLARVPLRDVEGHGGEGVAHLLGELPDPDPPDPDPDPRLRLRSPTPIPDSDPDSDSDSDSDSE